MQPIHLPADTTVCLSLRTQPASRERASLNPYRGWVSLKVTSIMPSISNRFSLQKRLWFPLAPGNGDAPSGALVPSGPLVCRRWSQGGVTSQGMKVTECIRERPAVERVASSRCPFRGAWSMSSELLHDFLCHEGGFPQLLVSTHDLNPTCLSDPTIHPSIHPSSTIHQPSILPSHHPAIRLSDCLSSICKLGR